MPNALRQVFRAVDVGDAGMVTVFHRDGFVVFREPSDTNHMGERAARDPLFMQDMEECMHDFRFVDAETARMIAADEDFDAQP